MSPTDTFYYEQIEEPQPMTPTDTVYYSPVVGPIIVVLSPSKEFPPMTPTHSVQYEQVDELPLVTPTPLADGPEDPLNLTPSDTVYYNDDLHHNDGTCSASPEDWQQQYRAPAEYPVLADYVPTQNL